MSEQTTASYAILDENNIVIEIFKGREENSDGIDWEEFYSNEVGKTVKRYSINTKGNVHINGKTPFRKNCAHIGGLYDPEMDAFYVEKPEKNPSYVFDTESATWIPPIEKPNDTDRWLWSECQTEWLRPEECWHFTNEYGFVDFRTRNENDPVGDD